ncbi:dentin matrix acidic phosphoprotein 1 isoform X2 [Pogoniulus pusillus]|uniref:dentin matrix acidic phosphoprotein 1 isoform X2 n=1 Tax=Pogoniulus pusillus TaxID=488313 RepID=UPI0030B97EFE
MLPVELRGAGLVEQVHQGLRGGGRGGRLRRALLYCSCLHICTLGTAVDLRVSAHQGVVLSHPLPQQLCARCWRGWEAVSFPAGAHQSASGTTTTVRAAFLVLLLWAIAYAHPVPSREPALHYHSAQQEDTAGEDYSNKLGNPLGAGDGRHSPASAGRGDNSLLGDPAAGNAVGEEMGMHGGHKAGRAGEVQHLNQVDREDASAWDGNSLGFLEEDAADTDDGEHYGPAVSGLPFHAGGFMDEEDESGDDTFDENGEEERGEGPTYVAGADGEGGHGYDGDRGDTGAGGGHGDSSSSSSESAGEDRWRYRSYPGSRYEQPYRRGGRSSSSQQEEEESYGFEDEAMQGDDPSVFDGLGSSYRGHRALGNSRESGQGAGSHRWQEGDSRSPELEDADSGEDSPSEEDNSESEEPGTSRSEENGTSRSEEGEDGEDSPSRESEDSESREDTAEQADEELRESPEDLSRESPEDPSRESPEEPSRELVSMGSEQADSQSREEQKDQQESAEDRSEPSAPDSQSEEEEGKPSESREDVSEQSQSAEDTAEESQEDEHDSEPAGDSPSASAESQSSSLQDDGSPESVAGEDSSSPESTDSESQQQEEEESYSQEDASSSRGDASSAQSLESSSRRRRPGAYRHKPAADYDDNDCQDGY